jgi:protein ImuA
MQGFKPFNEARDVGLSFMRDVFPNGSFPTGCVHEFLSERQEDEAATIGFVGGLLGALMGNSGVILWIGTSRKLFPPSLVNFGVNPDRIVFIDLRNEKEVLCTMEEALKCVTLSAVVGEVREIDFTTSRRFQLAIEGSRVTGFILRASYQKLAATACVSRWKISPLPSGPIDDLPGIGTLSWRVELLRMRNGKTGAWEVQWLDGRFAPVFKEPIQEQQKQAG